MDDVWARAVLLSGWNDAVPGDTPTLGAVQIVQAIARHETSYGFGWTNQMVGSHNMGAITCAGGKKDADGSMTCPASCAPNADSLPTANGQQSYITCFKTYPTPEAGMAGLVAFLHGRPRIWKVLDSGDVDAVTWAMRQEKYFLGFTTDARLAATQYANALWKLLPGIAQANGEAVWAFRGDQDDTTDPNASGSGAGAGDSGSSGLEVLGGAGLFSAVVAAAWWAAHRRAA
jgi:hypothetical protein